MNSEDQALWDRYRGNAGKHGPDGVPKDVQERVVTAARFFEQDHQESKPSREGFEKGEKGNAAFQTATANWEKEGKEIGSKLSGIDFSKPVTVEKIPPGAQFSQRQDEGRGVGAFFSRSGVPAENLGFQYEGQTARDGKRERPNAPEGKGNNHSQYGVYENKREVTALKSTAASFKASDYDKENGRTGRDGGGEQYCVSNKDKDAFQPKYSLQKDGGKNGDQANPDRGNQSQNKTEVNGKLDQRTADHIQRTNSNEKPAANVQNIPEQTKDKLNAIGQDLKKAGVTTGKNGNENVNGSNGNNESASNTGASSARSLSGASRGASNSRSMNRGTTDGKSDSRSLNGTGNGTSNSRSLSGGGAGASNNRSLSAGSASGASIGGASTSKSP